jgi:hypothetical protein
MEHANDQSATSGDPIRCQLNPAPSLWKKQPPPLALDVGRDAIRVVDSNTHALIASASLAQVTAKPAKYKHSSESGPTYTQPVLVVGVPGLQPLRIGTGMAGYSSWGGGAQFRYAWRGKVDSAKRPAYVVTEAQWLKLVEKFGLSTLIVDERASGEIDRRERFNRTVVIAMSALFFLLLLVWAISQFVR